MHMDADGPSEWFVNGFGRGPIYVDGQTVEDLLSTVAYGAAHKINDRNPPGIALVHSMGVLFDGLYAQRRLRQLTLWGGGLEVLATLLTLMGIVVAWRKSCTVAVDVEKVTDQALLAKVAVEAGNWEVGTAAVEKLTDQLLLAKVEVEARCWGVRDAAKGRLEVLRTNGSK